jgi:hypothetical protein
MKVRFAQHNHATQGGEGGEGGEGGANLPPDLRFGLRIAQMRGHLLVGDELVKKKQWNAALPHFLHPTEEIYAGIKDQLAEFKTPAFDTALGALADVVKDKKAGAAYKVAWREVARALDAAEAGLKSTQKDWPAFSVAAAVELVKSATGEYEAAIEDGKINKPVEYQDARGFVFHGASMVEAVASALRTKDATALKNVRASLKELKKAFPSPLPPKAPRLDAGQFSVAASKLELAAGSLK